MKILTQKDRLTPILIAILFTIAKIWKQSCLLMDEFKKKMQHICTYIYMYNEVLVSHKKE